jgi:iron(III) transport system substrate-binding protein
VATWPAAASPRRTASPGGSAPGRGRCGRRASGLLLALALLGAFACGGGDDRTPLVLYSPHGRDLLGLFERTYEEANPGIDVRWLDMGSQEVYDRIRAEAANPQADVWFGGPATVFARGAADGLLAPHRPPWADAVPAECRAPGDLYFCAYRTGAVLVFNDEVVAPDDAPADWDDLLLPQWRGKIVIRDPLASGTMRTVFGMVVARSVAQTGSTEGGFAWLRQLDGQTKEYVQNPALLFAKLARREGLITIWELTDMFWQKQRGIPLGYHFPASGTPIIDDSIGVVAGARHSAAARAFVDWVGTEEAQLLAAEGAYRLPARSDLPVEGLPPWAREVVPRMRPAVFDRDLVAREGARWMERWDREIRGRG